MKTLSNAFSGNFCRKTFKSLLILLLLVLSLANPSAFARGGHGGGHGGGGHGGGHSSGHSGGHGGELSSGHRSEVTTGNSGESGSVHGRSVDRPLRMVPSGHPFRSCWLNDEGEKHCNNDKEPFIVKFLTKGCPLIAVLAIIFLRKPIVRRKLRKTYPEIGNAALIPYQQVDPAALRFDNAGREVSSERQQEFLAYKKRLRLGQEFGWCWVCWRC